MALCTLAALAGCGKNRVAADVEPWEPATEANGFHPVEPDDAHGAPCVKRREPIEIRAFDKTTLASTSSARAIVADESHVYWIDTQENRQPVIDGRMLRPIAGTTIERVSRTNGARLRIAVPEGAATDLAIDAKHVYWSATGGPSAHAIWAWEKDTGHLQAVALEAAQRLVAQGWLVAWTRMRPDGQGEVRAFGSASAAYPPADITARTVATIPNLVPGALAIEGLTIFAASKDAIWAVSPSEGNKPKKIATTTYPPEDIAASGGWVWWIERGPARSVCNPDGTSPLSFIGHRGLSHPLGTLKRTKIFGGGNDLVAADLVDVHTLTVRQNTAWIATPYGLLRVLPGTEPTREPLRSTVRLVPVDDGVIGAAYDMGQEDITLVRAKP